MQMLVSETTSCSENWADYSWAELSNVCFGDAPWHVRYFDVILIMLFFVSIMLAAGAIIIYLRNKAKRPDYHRYLVWYGVPLLIVAVIFWLWVFTTHRTPQAVITSIYSSIPENNLFVLSPDGVGLIYDRTLSMISIVVLLLTSQLAWIAILLWDPRGSGWIAVKYPEICPPSTGYKFQMDGLKEWHRKAGIVFIGDSTFYLRHCENTGLIQLSIKNQPPLPYVQCRYRVSDGMWSATRFPSTNNHASTHEEFFDSTITITESITITLEPLWYCNASGGCCIAT